MLFFLFKQKTADEMRISDWSSDVCSSDLTAASTRKPIVPTRAKRANTAEGVRAFVRAPTNSSPSPLTVATGATGTGGGAGDSAAGPSRLAGTAKAETVQETEAGGGEMPR